jgi:NADPH2:quinone reductase
VKGQMRALLVTGARDWELAERAVPQPAEGQVLMAASAAALNNADVKQLDAGQAEAAAGLIESRIAGYEVVGLITAVGAGVSQERVGTRVIASATAAFAEYVACDSRAAVPVPDSVPDIEAAALPTALLTEHGALRAGSFQPGHTVLITGATAAIGLVGIQIAQAIGARQVIATPAHHPSSTC